MRQPCTLRGPCCRCRCHPNELDTRRLSPDISSAALLAEIRARGTGSVTPAVYPSTTYERAPDNSYPLGKCYSRDDNPTVLAAETALAELERGEKSLLFSSGMAAATAVQSPQCTAAHPPSPRDDAAPDLQGAQHAAHGQVFQVLAPGDHVVIPRVMYWALRGWVLDFAAQWGVEVSVIAMDGPDGAFNVSAAVRPNTKCRPRAPPRRRQRAPRAAHAACGAPTG